MNGIPAPSRGMIPGHLTPRLLEAAASPVFTLMGPRRSGKTTLVRHAFPEHEDISLEAPDTRLDVTSLHRKRLRKRPRRSDRNEVGETVASTDSFEFRGFRILP